MRKLTSASAVIRRSTLSRRLVVDVAGWIEEGEVRGVSGIVAEAGTGGCSPVLTLI